MRTPKGWHKAWRKNAALFQNAVNIIKHAPTTARSSRLRVSLRSLATPWPAASLPASRLAALACYAVAGRSSPLYVGLRCVASLRRSGLNFLFLRYPGFRGSRLRVSLTLACYAVTGRRSTAGLFYDAPYRGSEFRSRLRCCAATPWLAPTAHANVRCHSRERLGLTPLHTNALYRSRERSALRTHARST